MKDNRKEYLVCIDSDGCAMDTMERKHRTCFGPKLIEVYGLKIWESEILHRWNVMNLYQITRGINRFRGLNEMLKEVSMYYKKIENLEPFSYWVEHTTEFSEDALMEEISRRNGEETGCLEKALLWSQLVNKAIREIPKEEMKAFPGVKQAMEAAKEKSRIAIVSSANHQAVWDEWGRNGLLELVDEVMTQECGKKADIIADFISQGFEKEKIIMLGDARGDFEAAQKNGVLFYPIIPKNEADSWKLFLQEAYLKFLEGSYAGEYQELRMKAFLESLESVVI